MFTLLGCLQFREMEKHAAIKNSCKLCQRNRKPNIRKVIKESDRLMNKFQDRQLKCWVEHKRKEFSWPITTVGFAPMLVKDLSRVNISPPCKMKMVREIGFLERHKAVGLNGLSQFTFKDSDKVIKSESKKCCNHSGQGRR